jgi:hypothetical protein
MNDKWKLALLKKIDAFSTQSDSLSAKFCHIFHAFFSALKVKRFQPNFIIFFNFSRIFFTNSENTTKSKFSQETLNLLSPLKFMGSHLAFHD